MPAANCLRAAPSFGHRHQTYIIKYRLFSSLVKVEKHFFMARNIALTINHAQLPPFELQRTGGLICLATHLPLHL